jgi:multicomponent K+:H+ antiporter subunit G
MIQTPDLPMWASVLVAFLLLVGAIVTLIGSAGLLRLRHFHQRMHTPTLGSTLGTGCILLGSMVCFSTLQSRPLNHEVLIALFLTLTNPVGFMLLARAALYRSHVEGSKNTATDRQ